MKVKEMVSFVFGDISDDEYEAIIYGCTGYPCFWGEGDVAKIKKAPPMRRG